MVPWHQLSDSHHSPHTPPVVLPKASSVQLPFLTPVSSPPLYFSLDGLPQPIRFPPPSCQNATRGRNKTLPLRPPRLGGMGWAARKNTRLEDTCLRPLGSLGWGGAPKKQSA